jgi:hypothetical protein
MMRDFPELIDNHNFVNNLNITFNSNELFEEWKYLSNLEKRSSIASTLISNIQNAEGQPYLSTEWVIRNIMKFTDRDIEENKKYKIKEQGQLSNVQGVNDEEMGEEEGFDLPSGPGTSYFKEKGMNTPQNVQMGGQTQVQPTPVQTPTPSSSPTPVQGGQTPPQGGQSQTGA